MRRFMRGAAARTRTLMGRRAVPLKRGAEGAGAEGVDGPPEQQQQQSKGRRRRRGGGGGLGGPMLVFGVFLAAAIAIWAATAYGVQPEEVLDDPALEERAREISKGLRCVVCQNQSIDDSDADIAGDMRVLVRERLLAGDTDAEVRDALVASYGEFVLMTPRFSLSNLAIWLAPLMAAGVGLFWYLQRTGRTAAARGVAQEAAPAGPAPLSDDETARLRELLKD